MFIHICTMLFFSDLLVGMKVDRSKDEDDLRKKETRGQQVKRLVSKTKQDVQQTRFVQRKSSQSSEQHTDRRDFKRR